MSCIIDGELRMPPRMASSHGGTENMARMFMKYVPKESYKNFQIHISKVTQPVDNSKIQILWEMDNHCDQDTPVGKHHFDEYVFISDWQRHQFIREHGLPYEKTSVIETAIDFVPKDVIEKPTDKINFVYASVPDRGLDILYDTFDLLTQKYDNLHLTVFSSYKLYNWDDVDQYYVELFDKIKNHKNITYRGFAPDYNDVIEAKYNSHFFLYPCTWLENSGISLIESLACGCICIHTDFHAHPETSEGRSISYTMPPIREDHVRACYEITDQLIQRYLNGIITFPLPFPKVLYKHTTDHLRQRWLELFARLDKK